MTRIQRETGANIVILAFCILMFTWAIPGYTPAYPGYGASPALVANVAVGIMLVMSLLALVRNAISKYGGKALSVQDSEFPDGDEGGGFTQMGRIKLFRLISFMVPCALLVIGIEYIGYVPAAVLFMLLIQYVIGSRQILRSVTVSVVSVAVMYIIMRYGFGVPVPGPQLF